MVYYEYEKQSEKKEEVGSFENIMNNFFKRIINVVWNPIEEIIEKKQKEVIKKIQALIILWLGGIFLLTSLANLISAYIGLGLWTGYGIIGLTLFSIGLINYNQLR